MNIINLKIKIMSQIIKHPVQINFNEGYPETNANNSAIQEVITNAQGKFKISPKQVEQIATLLNQIYDENANELEDDEEIEDHEEYNPFSHFITELAYHAGMTSNA